VYESGVLCIEYMLISEWARRAAPGVTVVGMTPCVIVVLTFFSTMELFDRLAMPGTMSMQITNNTVQMISRVLLILLSPSVKIGLVIPAKIRGIFQTLHCSLFLLWFSGFQPGSEKDLFCVYKDSFK
jgi:hypothetical protein